jgi:mono/diheme cytochrome c family protein
MKHCLIATALLLMAQAYAQTQHAPQQAAGLVERGRYLVKIAGCNDCHTAGYTQSNGKTPEKEWLQGDELGWQGPWGTTYGTNLRLHFSKLSEQQWLQQARTMQPCPPMPWFAPRDMTDRDLKALYAHVRAAGPAGRPAPAYVPPETSVQVPVVRFPG